jgi:hypothetical protein
MPAVVTLTMASFGFWIVGFGRFSTAIFQGPLKTTASIV